MKPKLTDQSGSVLIASLISIVILLTVFLAVFSYSMARYSLHMKSQFKTRAAYLAESGINRSIHMLQHEEISFTKLKDDALFLSFEGFGSATVTSRPYGAYMLLTSIGESGSQKSVYRSVIGSAPISATENAITLTDARYPLTVTGTTVITGDILTGPKEIATGIIDGRGIVSDSFHLGSHIIDQSSLNIPVSMEIVDEYLEYITSSEPLERRISGSLVLGENDRYFLNQSDGVFIEGGLDINGLQWESEGPVRTIIAEGPVTIRGDTRLHGMLEVVSKEYIILTDSAQLLGGVLYARDSVVFNGDCLFAGQGIARHKLLVRDRAQVTYPSALIILLDRELPNDEQYPSLVITSRRKTSAVCALINAGNEQPPPGERIYLDSLAGIEGVIFSSAYTELHGTIHGSVVTRNFYYNIPPTVYINWLYDVRINRENLGWTTILPFIFENTSKIGVFSQRKDDV